MAGRVEADVDTHEPTGLLGAEGASGMSSEHDLFGDLFPDDLDNVTSALSRQRAEQL